MTNNPAKILALVDLGINVVNRIGYSLYIAHWHHK